MLSTVYYNQNYIYKMLIFLINNKSKFLLNICLQCTGTDGDGGDAIFPLYHKLCSILHYAYFIVTIR